MVRPSMQPNVSKVSNVEIFEQPLTAGTRSAVETGPQETADTWDRVKTLSSAISEPRLFGKNLALRLEHDHVLRATREDFGTTDACRKRRYRNVLRGKRRCETQALKA